MITDFLFNKNVAGCLYKSQGGFIYDLNGSNFAGVYTELGGSAVSRGVTLNGWYFTRDDGPNMYQVIGGRYIDIAEGWEKSGMGTTYSQSQSQKLVDGIIANNKTILQNNLVCARFLYKLDADQKELLLGLQKRLKERDNALRKDGICANLVESYPKGYANLADLNKLEGLIHPTGAMFGIGSVTLTTTAIIIISAVVIASLSTAAYFAYRAYYNESEQDVKWSKELTATLASKLTDEEYAQLKAETAGIVTKARLKASLSSLSGVAKYALIAGGVYLLYNSLKNKF